VASPARENRVDSEKAVTRRSQRVEGAMEPVVVERVIVQDVLSKLGTVAVVVTVSEELVVKLGVVVWREACIAEMREERVVEGGKERKCGSTSHERRIVPE
jgi:hypothetical protein